MNDDREFQCTTPSPECCFVFLEHSEIKNYDAFKVMQDSQNTLAEQMNTTKDSIYGDHKEMPFYSKFSFGTLELFIDVRGNVFKPSLTYSYCKIFSCFVLNCFSIFVKAMVRRVLSSV